MHRTRVGGKADQTVVAATPGAVTTDQSIREQVKMHFLLDKPPGSG